MQEKRYINIALLASLCLLITTSSYSQNYRDQMKLIRLKPNNVKVFGKIHDYTGDKITGAKISLLDPALLSTLETIPIDDQGDYLFTLKKGKKIGFLVEKKGYFPYYHELTIPFDSENEYEYNLHLPDGIRKDYSLVYTQEGTIPSNTSILEELISLLINQAGLSLWMPAQQNPLGQSRNFFLDSLLQDRGIESYRLISGSLPGNSDQIVVLNFITDPDANEADASIFLGEKQNSPNSDNNDKWTLQFTASRNKLSEKDLKKLENTMVFEGKDGFYRYTYGVFETRQQANKAIPLLKEKGFGQAFPKLIGKLKKL